MWTNPNLNVFFFLILDIVDKDFCIFKSDPLAFLYKYPLNFLVPLTKIITHLNNSVTAEA